MPRHQPSLQGETIQVPSGLHGRCDTCEMYGRNARLLTDGTEVATVVEEEHFNGKFSQGHGMAAVWLECPLDGGYVQFPLGVRL